MKTRSILFITILIFLVSIEGNAIGEYSSERIAKVASALTGSAKAPTFSQIEELLMSLARTQLQIQIWASELEDATMKNNWARVLRPNGTSGDLPTFSSIARKHNFESAKRSLALAKESEKLILEALATAKNNHPFVYNTAFARFNLVPGTNRRFSPRSGKIVGAGLVAVTIAGIVYYLNFDETKEQSEEMIQDSAPEGSGS